MSEQARLYEEDLARCETEQTVSAATHEPGRSRSSSKLLIGTTGTLLAFSAVTGVLAYLDHRQSVEAEVSGTSTFVDMRDGYSISVAKYQKPVSGRSIHDNEWPVKSSWGNMVGFFNTQIEYAPNGSLEISAVDDPDLGFYLLVREREGKDSHPLEFTYDTPGGEEDNEATMRLKVIDPQPCPIDLSDEKAVPASYCTPLNSEDSRGLYSDQANEGPSGFVDNTVAREAALALDLGARNAYCELAALGTPSIASMMDGDMSGITPYSIYDGVETAVMARIRVELSAQYNLPITNAYGGFYILNDSNVEMLKDIVVKIGHPLVGMKPDEFRAQAQTAELDRLLDPSGETIDPGPTYVTQLLDLRERYGDIELPVDDPAITEENANSSSWNYMCISGNSKRSGGKRAIIEEWYRNRAGKFGWLIPNATMAPDFVPEPDSEEIMVQTFTPAEAAAKVAVFREVIGI